MDTPDVSAATCKTKVLTDEQRARRNKRRHELYHEKKQSTMSCDVDRRERINQWRQEAYHAKEATQSSVDKSKSKQTRAQLKWEYKRRQREFQENNLHPDSIAIENPQYTPQLIFPSEDQPTIRAEDLNVPESNLTLLYIPTTSNQVSEHPALEQNIELPITQNFRRGSSY